MNKLLSIISLAIATVIGYKNALAKLTQEIDAVVGENASLKHQNEKLRLELAQEPTAQELEDANQRASIAEARRAELESMLKEAETKADELATVLNETPETPSVDGEFNIVTPEPPAEPVDAGLSDPTLNPENSAPEEPTPAPEPTPAE